MTVQTGPHDRPPRTYRNRDFVWWLGVLGEWDAVSAKPGEEHVTIPQHQRGVSTEPGVYFLGLPWLSHRGSSFTWGVWHDAKYIADHIATQRRYIAYRDAAQQQG